MRHSEYFAKGRGWKSCQWALAMGILGLGLGCDQGQSASKEGKIPVIKEISGKAAVGDSPVVQAARSQIGKTTIYDPAYVRLD